MRALTSFFSFILFILLFGCAKEPEAIEDDLTLAILGQSLIEHDPRDYFENPLSTITPTLERADVVFTNMEVAIKGEDCLDCVKTRDDVFFHGAGPSVIDYLQSIGVSMISLANNHTWDYGAGGILSGKAEVLKRGIATTGTGENAEVAVAPAYHDKGGVRFGLVAAASVMITDEARATTDRAGINYLIPGNEEDWTRNLASISEGAANSDITIAYQHYQTDAPDGWQQQWARAAIDAGADIYVGDGEPHIWGVEVYNDGLIIYGMSNFIFHSRTALGNYPPEAWHSVFAEISISDGNLSAVTFTPIKLDPGTEGPLFNETRGYPEVATGELSSEIIDHLIGQSEQYGTHFEMLDGKVQIDLQP